MFPEVRRTLCGMAPTAAHPLKHSDTLRTAHPGLEVSPFPRQDDKRKLGFKTLPPTPTLAGPGSQVSFMVSPAGPSGERPLSSL